MLQRSIGHFLITAAFNRMRAVLLRIGIMSDSEVKQDGRNRETLEKEAEQRTPTGIWTDETVDAIAALIVVTCVTLMALWFVIS
ncbi:MAG: hypothetical protein EA417_09115 [Gammaproteobacteria bacterium]|nr:MAG: hypothetical protein EA417_09115 [Gammaproteobacteria bacterium]